MSRRTLASSLLAVLSLGAAVPALAGGARLFKSGPIQSTADGAWVWVVNPDADTVSKIETATGAVTEYPLPDRGQRHAPLGLAVREDGTEVWVACHDSDRVYVLAPNGTWIQRIDLPWGSGPHSLALSRDQQRVLVTLHRAEALALLDAGAHALERRLAPVFPGPLGVVWTEDGVNAWVTHLFADGEDPHLTRVDVSGPIPRVKTDMIAGSTEPKRSSALAAPNNFAEGGYLTFRGHLAQVPSAARPDRLFIPTQYNNINEDVFSPDSTIQSTIRTLEISTRRIPNANTDKVILTARYVHDPSNGAATCAGCGPGWDAHVSGPVDVGFSADGTVAHVLFEQSNDLLVMPTNLTAANLTGAPPLSEIPVGHRPLGLTVLSSADVAYVWDSLDAAVSVVDLAAQTVLRAIPVSSRLPLDGGRLLNGARLFHTSDDPRISVNQKVSCASCHPHGEHDGRTWDFENLPGSHGPRSSMSLLGIAASMGPPDPATGWGQLHRSGDRDEIQDFEHTFQGVSMMGTGFLGGGVQPELGPSPNAGLDADLDDIADYIASLPPLMRSPYRDAAGNLTEAALRGATFFRGSDPGKPADAACATCHVPATGFVDFGFHDVGQRRATNERELNSRTPAWHVNTPTLVGVFATAPYDGVTTYASTMLDVLQDLARRTTHGRPGQLTRRQLLDLSDFVLSIDGNTTAAEVAAAADTVPPRIDRVSVTSPTRIEVWFNEGVDASAASPSAWRVREVGGPDLPVTGGTWDAQNGDRVTLQVDRLRRDCVPVTYELSALGPIRDLADRATGGVANLLDSADAVNTTTFSLGDTLTITLGASAHEDVSVRTHDAATILGFNNGAHGSPWLIVNNSGQASTGFVRFDWKAAFVAATGVASSSDIVDASISLMPEMGDVQTVEARRCLLSWSDVGQTDWAYDRSRGSIGAPTLTEHVEGSMDGDNPWNAQNAGRSTAGVDGRNAADYDGANDTAATPDAVLLMDAINERFTIAGPGVTDAFRFWFDNPSVDYGYALRVVPTSPFTQRLYTAKFVRGEGKLQRDAPVLTITYALPLTPANVPPEVSGPASPEELRVAKDPGGLRLSFEDLGAAATAYDVYEGAIGSWYSHQGASCNFVPAAAGGRRDLVHLAATEDAYYLVTATDACSEGPSGTDSFATPRPASNLDCPP
jgi:DNA-binding beta-propeller fold protein YncE